MRDADLALPWAVIVNTLSRLWSECVASANDLFWE